MNLAQCFVFLCIAASKVITTLPLKNSPASPVSPKPDALRKVSPKSVVPRTIRPRRPTAKSSHSGRTVVQLLQDRLEQRTENEGLAGALKLSDLPRQSTKTILQQSETLT